MGTKTTFICDCCFREADNNLGWAHVTVNGASDDKQLDAGRQSRPVRDLLESTADADEESS